MKPNTTEWHEIARRLGIGAEELTIALRVPAEGDSEGWARYEAYSADVHGENVRRRAARAGITHERLEAIVAQVMGPHRVRDPKASRFCPYVSDPVAFVHNACAESLGSLHAAHVWPTWSAAQAWIDEADRAEGRTESWGLITEWVRPRGVERVYAVRPAIVGNVKAAHPELAPVEIEEAFTATLRAPDGQEQREGFLVVVVLPGRAGVAAGEHPGPVSWLDVDQGLSGIPAAMHALERYLVGQVSRP